MPICPSVQWNIENNTAPQASQTAKIVAKSIDSKSAERGSGIEEMNCSFADVPPPRRAGFSSALPPTMRQTSSPVLVLVRDLLFASKISGTAQAMQVSVKMIRDPEKLAAEHGDRLIVDLNRPGALEAAASWKSSAGGSVIGFVSTSIGRRSIAPGSWGSTRSFPRASSSSGSELLT